MLFICLGISAVFLVVANAVAFAYKGAGGVGRASLCGVAGVVGFALCAGPVVLPLNALLVAAVGAVCWRLQARRRWFLASSVFATVVAYVLIVLPELWAWDQLKPDYPLESLAGRLAFENRTPSTPTPRSTEALSSSTAERLTTLESRMWQAEQNYDSFVRTRSLELLHAGMVRQFIDSPGFGVGRMMGRTNPFRLRRERQTGPLPPTPQPTPPYTPADLAPAPVQVAPGFDFLMAHDDNTLDFLNPVDFGYIRDRDHVAGFRPHQFHDNPKAPPRWRVTRLELVGLLKYDEPEVYLSADLPRMDELSQAPARPPDAFEREALVKLRDGEDLVVQEALRQMRMLGSIRAAYQCLRCHDVRRGELLGAFSYRLSPEEPPAP